MGRVVPSVRWQMALMTKNKTDKQTEEIRPVDQGPGDSDLKKAMEKGDLGRLLSMLAAGVPADDRIRQAQVGTGTKLVKPEDMSYGDAIEILRRRQKEEETPIQISELVEAFPIDGARALSLAVEEQFGVAFQQTSWSFFGPELPQRIAVKTPTGEIVVPWGQMKLPGLKDTTIETSVGRAPDGAIVFQFSCSTLQKHEKKIRKLLARTHELVIEKSFYRGQALKVDFKRIDQPGYSPEFMDTESRDGSVLILNSDTEALLNGSVLTPIEKTAICRKMNIPLRRGVLLEGPFGTGKTLSAQKVARSCAKNGWTFIYVQDSIYLPAAKRLARRYQPAVIFAEDLDQILAKDSKTIEEVRNALDAVDNKNDEVIVLCTTNRLEVLKNARGMLRPGRFDALIHVGYPNKEAAERLLRHYANSLLAETEPLDEAAAMLAGNSAAMIRECVERAKLWSIAHGTQGSLHQKDLVYAAKELKTHIDVMADKAVEVPSKEHQLGTLVQEVVVSGVGSRIKELEKFMVENFEHFHTHLRK